MHKLTILENITLLSLISHLMYHQYQSNLRSLTIWVKMIWIIIFFCKTHIHSIRESNCMPLKKNTTIDYVKEDKIWLRNLVKYGVLYTCLASYNGLVYTEILLTIRIRQRKWISKLKYLILNTMMVLMLPLYHLNHNLTKSS